MRIIPTQVFETNGETIRDVMQQDAQRTNYLQIPITDIHFDKDQDDIVLVTPNTKAIHIVRDYTVTQLVNKLWGYTKAFRSLPTDIQLDVIQHFFKERVTRKRNEQWKIPTFEEFNGQLTAKAFLSQHYQFILTEKLASMIDVAKKELASNFVLEKGFWSWQNARLRYLNPEAEKPTELGQRVTFGFQLQNSEVGLGSIRTFAISKVIECANMAVYTRSSPLNDGIRHIWINPRKVKNRIIESIKEIDENVVDIQAMMNKAASIEVPVAYRVGRHLRVWRGKPSIDYRKLLQGMVSQKTIKAVIGSYNLERGNTLWHMFNAINYAENIAKITISERMVLQELFGTLIDELRNIKIVDIPKLESNKMKESFDEFINIRVG